MEQSFNVLSTAILQQDIELVSDKNGISISPEAFVMKEHLNTPNAPYFIEEITLIIVRSGKARIRINLNEFSVSKNTIVILTPNCIIEMLEYNEKIEADILLFNYDVVADLPLTKELGSLVEIFNDSPTLVLRDDDFREISDMYAVLAYHCNKQKLLKSEVTKNILYALCYLVVDLYRQEKITTEVSFASRLETLYQNFSSLLFLHYKKERSITFYSDKLHVTPKYFSKVVKNVSKRNASDLIDEMVIMGIKASLKCTDQSVLQISEEFNFPNPSFFGTFFKKKTGFTPLGYRNL